MREQSEQHPDDDKYRMSEAESGELTGYAYALYCCICAAILWFLGGRR
jgi:hypothetical protein